MALLVLTAGGRPSGPGPDGVFPVRVDQQLGHHRDPSRPQRSAAPTRTRHRRSAWSRWRCEGSSPGAAVGEVGGEAPGYPALRVVRAGRVLPPEDRPPAALSSRSVLSLPELLDTVPAQLAEVIATR